MKAAFLTVLVALAACATPVHMRLRFEDEKNPTWFEFEEDKVALSSGIRIAEVDPKFSPSGKQVLLEGGDSAVLWFYHFEDDGDPLADRERGFTLAFELRRLEPGTIEFPNENDRVTFFCDRWAPGYKAAVARLAKGKLIITEVSSSRVEGWLNLELKGNKERKEGEPEPLKILLHGKFTIRR